MPRSLLRQLAIIETVANKKNFGDFYKNEKMEEQVSSIIDKIKLPNIQNQKEE